MVEYHVVFKRFIRYISDSCSIRINIPLAFSVLVIAQTAAKRSTHPFEKSIVRDEMVVDDDGVEKREIFSIFLSSCIFLSPFFFLLVKSKGQKNEKEGVKKKGWEKEKKKRNSRLQKRIFCDVCVCVCAFSSGAFRIDRGRSLFVDFLDSTRKGTEEEEEEEGDARSINLRARSAVVAESF